MLEENTKNNARSQREVCSTIYDTGDVIKNKIATTIMGYVSLKENIKPEDVKELQGLVDRDITEQVNSLVDRVIKALS